MTPYETALHLMRQRDTTLSEHRPGETHFVVAYLLEEASRTKSGNPLALSPRLSDRMRANREALIDSIDAMKIVAGGLRAAFVDIGEAVARAGRQMQNDTSDQPFGRI